MFFPSLISTLMMTWILDWYIGHGLNIEPFNKNTTLDFLNTGLFWYSDPHCILFVFLYINNQVFFACENECFRWVVSMSTYQVSGFFRPNKKIKKFKIWNESYNFWDYEGEIAQMIRQLLHIPAILGSNLVDFFMLQRAFDEQGIGVGSRTFIVALLHWLDYKTRKIIIG